jgi:hypothetical protein
MNFDKFLRFVLLLIRNDGQKIDTLRQIGNIYLIIVENCGSVNDISIDVSDKNFFPVELVT